MIRTATTSEPAQTTRGSGSPKGSPLPATRRPIDNMIVHPTST